MEARLARSLEAGGGGEDCPEETRAVQPQGRSEWSESGGAWCPGRAGRAGGAGRVRKPLGSEAWPRGPCVVSGGVEPGRLCLPQSTQLLPAAFQASKSERQKQPPPPPPLPRDRRASGRARAQRLDAALGERGEVPGSAGSQRCVLCSRQGPKSHPQARLGPPSRCKLPRSCLSLAKA